MASDTGKLTVLKVKAAAAGKHFDGGGLFLRVTDAGRYWRMKYRHAGKEKLLALGVYPEVTLSEARQRRDAARNLLRDGNDQDWLSVTVRSPVPKPPRTHSQPSPRSGSRSSSRACRSNLCQGSLDAG